MTKIENFADDLRERYEKSRLRGRINYYAAYIVLIGAVLSSALATISVAVEFWPKEINALLAAMPGVFYLMNRRFRFEERAQWWYDKFYILEGLYRGLVREKRSEADVSKELTIELRKLEERWPSFGKAPGQE